MPTPGAPNQLSEPVGLDSAACAERRGGSGGACARAIEDMDYMTEGACEENCTARSYMLLFDARAHLL